MVIEQKKFESYRGGGGGGRKKKKKGVEKGVEGEGGEGLP
jgi:hypothetical protein